MLCIKFGHFLPQVTLLANSYLTFNSGGGSSNEVLSVLLFSSGTVRWDPLSIFGYNMFSVISSDLIFINTLLLRHNLLTIKDTDLYTPAQPPFLSWHVYCPKKFSFSLFSDTWREILSWFLTLHYDFVVLKLQTKGIIGHVCLHAWLFGCF